MTLSRLPPGYFIRSYTRSDAAALAAVEFRAARLFAEHGYPVLAESPPSEPATFDRLAAENTVLVAAHVEGGPVGFAVAGQIGAFLHLKELSVDPAHGRRGLGTALLLKVVAGSLENGEDGVSLTTFRGLPFNEHFYARQGFVEWLPEQAPAPLAARFLEEVPPGVAAETRLLMVRRNRRGPAEKP